jgi:S1-C subfamily serine protease
MSAAKASASQGALSELSSQLAVAVERAADSVVAIHARRRIPSSGIVWRDGVIVSASHTVQRDDDIKITLPSGESSGAAIIGRDATTDLVALRVKASAHVASRGDAQSLRVGALVLAVGRPGRNATASFGIVSAIGEGWRTWEGTRLDRVARLDVAVYDGFSGGALIDASGAVLGVNNSALARGTPMALPTSTVDRVVDELVARGHVRRPFIGVAVQPVALSAAVVQQLRLSHDGALLVTSVADKSPAERAGLLVGDVLLEANGEALRRPTDLLDTLGKAPAGESITIKLLRAGAAKSISVVPADRRETP